MLFHAYLPNESYCTRQPGLYMYGMAMVLGQATLHTLIQLPTTDESFGRTKTLKGCFVYWSRTLSHKRLMYLDGRQARERGRKRLLGGRYSRSSSPAPSCPKQILSQRTSTFDQLFSSLIPHFLFIAPLRCDFICFRDSRFLYHCPLACLQFVHGSDMKALQDQCCWVLLLGIFFISTNIGRHHYVTADL